MSYKVIQQSQSMTFLEHNRSWMRCFWILKIGCRRSMNRLLCVAICNKERFFFLFLAFASSFRILPISLLSVLESYTALAVLVLCSFRFRGRLLFKFSSLNWQPYRRLSLCASQYGLGDLLFSLPLFLSVSAFLH